MYFSFSSASLLCPFPSVFEKYVFVAVLAGIEFALIILDVFVRIWIVFEQVGAFVLFYWLERLVCPIALIGLLKV